MGASVQAKVSQKSGTTRLNMSWFTVEWSRAPTTATERGQRTQAKGPSPQAPLRGEDRNGAEEAQVETPARTQR